MTRIFFNVLILCIPFLLVSCNEYPEHGSAKDCLAPIDSLNKIIEQAPYYAGKKLAYADSLRQVAELKKDTFQKAEDFLTLSKVFRQTNSDSAIKYASLAEGILKNHPDEDQRIMSRLVLADALTTAGLFSEAKQILSDLDIATLSPELKIEYWKSNRLFYTYCLSYLNVDNEFSDYYHNLSMNSDDSLFKNLRQDDPYYIFISAERNINKRKWDMATHLLQYLLNNNPKESNIFGMSAFLLAEVYRFKGEHDNYIKTLALAAESDIMGVVYEGAALPSLATEMYKQGDFENALKYINLALEEANSGNIRMRTPAIASNLAMIEKAYNMKIENNHKRMVVLIVFLIVVSVVSLVLSGFLIRNYYIYKREKGNLAISTKKLRTVIGNFIELSSNYAARLDQLSKMVVRKINAGQSDELTKLLSSGRFSEDNNSDFYKLIDKSILDIFPNFVDNINALLKEDSKIKPEETSEHLTPELRIYACVRMGVDQSSKIAHILHYSVNTVYAYRNKMRNRAINHDLFDKEVAALGEE